MSTRAAQMLGHPPGLNFHPDDDELVAFFLLPSARGEPAWFPAVVVIQDDTAANTLPWNLLKRHGLDDDDEAYFLVHSNDAATARKADRYCDGGGTWVSQRPVAGGACIGGEEIKWRRINLNLHMGHGKRGGGSTGWVMHEYTLTEPACPLVKICHVVFSGHGKDRKRVPDNEAGEPAASSTKRARIDAAANYNGSVAMMDQQGYGAGMEHGFGEEAGLPTQFARDFFQHLIKVTNTQACPAGEPTTISDQDQPCSVQAHASSCTGQQKQSPPFPIYQQGMISSPMMAHQQQMVMRPLPPDDSQAQAGDLAANYDSNSATTCAYGSTTTTCAYGSTTTTVADQDSGAPAVQLSNCWPSPPQLMVQLQEITGMEEQQYGRQQGDDQQEQQEFWDSIGVDTSDISGTFLLGDNLISDVHDL